MPQFVARFEKKLDAKGRLLVPKVFRDQLKGQDWDGVILSRSFGEDPVVEAYGLDYLAQLNRSLQAKYSPFSPEYQALSTRINADCERAAWDSDGRISLPQWLIDYAGLKDVALFVGCGETFRIWEPAAYERYVEKSRIIANAIAPNLMMPGNPGAVS